MKIKRDIDIQVLTTECFALLDICIKLWDMRYVTTDTTKHTININDPV